MKNFLVSVIIPSYNEQDNIAPLVQRLTAVLKNNPDYEIIFIDDGSTDETLSCIQAERRKNKHIQYLTFTRNFGHQFAIKAGLDYASGACVISMDADLQHEPELVPDMISAWQEGFDVVYMTRQSYAQESWFKKATSAWFYKIFNVMSDTKIPYGCADFRLLDRKVVDFLISLPERTLFLRGLIFWSGFKIKQLPHLQVPRNAGKTSYTLGKMIQLAIAGATSFSLKPLRFAVYLGLFVSAFGFLFTLYVFYLKFFTTQVITGWSSTLSVVLVLGGVQLFIMGIIGEYLGMVLTESKHRPTYVIADKTVKKQK